MLRVYAIENVTLMIDCNPIFIKLTIECVYETTRLFVRQYFQIKSNID